jgi:reprolysin-like metallo-peptidase family M12B
VKMMLGGDGVTKTNGPCNKKEKRRMTGVVVRVGNDDARNGTVFAHEVGHYLGLDHCQCNDPACDDKLMRGGGCNTNSNTVISPADAAKLRTHCAVRP